MARKISRDAAAVAYPSTRNPILKPAPGGLRIVQAWVNTLNSETGQDAWKDPAALADWLGYWRLISGGTKLGPADLERAVAIRRGFRAMFLAHSGADLDEEAVARLDHAVSTACLRVRFTTGTTPAFEPDGSGFDEACARLVEIVAVAHSENHWTRLKICARGACRQGFYDYSGNRSAKWCTSRCGNLLKSRTFRRRHPGG